MSVGDFTKPRVIRPGDVVPNALEAPVCFLGGPITDAPDWQAEATAMLWAVLPNNWVIANPRACDFPCEEEAAFEKAFDEQVLWEERAINASIADGITLFWCPPQVTFTPGRCYGQSTRFELGWLCHEPEGTVVVGMHPAFSGRRYIEAKGRSTGQWDHVLSTLEDTVESAAQWARTW